MATLNIWQALKTTTQTAQANLYDQALDILDKLLTDEEDFNRASLLNSIMVDLGRLKHGEIKLIS